MGINQRQQIVMSDDEITAFLHHSRTGTLATLGPGGQPHLVAMWFAVLDDEIWLETKTKSQKAVNIRRNPRISFLIEDGLTYDTLRGVSFDGLATVVTDPDIVLRVGINLWQRYHGPYSDTLKPAVETMMNNRIAIRINTTRKRSWDHHKLGIPAIPLGGSTAPGNTT